MRSPRFYDPPTFPRWVMVAQIFDHQTDHRSQVTSAFHTMDIDYGATDILWRPGAGWFAGENAGMIGRPGLSRVPTGQWSQNLSTAGHSVHFSIQ